jgi:hypothetical protein
MGNIVLTHYDPLELRGTHGHPIFRQTHPRLGGFCNGYRVIISSWGLSKNAGYRTISMFLLQEIDDNKLVFNGIMITGASLSNSGIEVIFDIYRFKCTSTYDLVPFLDLVYIYISIYYIQHNYVYTYTRVVNCHPARHVVIGLKASSVFCHCPSDRATLVTSDVLKFTMRPHFLGRFSSPGSCPS